ncbi:MAG: acyl-CoA synthetase [Rhodospirillales bacterium]|nr:acyl-CoA synthetase [Rhodospirillales bacterium]
MKPMSFASILAQAEYDGVAVSWRAGAVLTRRDLLADTAAMAAAVVAAGCRRGAVVSSDSYLFLVAVLGLTSAGATAVVPPNVQPGTLAGLAGAFDHLVSDQSDLPGPRIALRHGAGGGKPIPCRPEAGLIEFFTSGSTGAPKHIEKSLLHLEREAAALDTQWPDLPPDATAVATVPHQHIYGLAFKVVWPLLTGRPFAPHMEDYWESLIDGLSPGAVVVSSPAHLTRLGGLPPVPPDRRPRMVLSAGAPLPQWAADDATRIFGIPIDEIYGSTETGAVATRRRDCGNGCWRPLPGVATARGDDGRLRLRARHVDETSWVATDDRVEVSSEGFTLLGRTDRVVKIEGKRVALAEVEQALTASPLVAGAAAIALPGERAILAAVVIPSQAGQAKLAEIGPFRLGRLLRRELAFRLEAAGLPRRWRFTPALPIGPMGKTHTADLVALFEERKHG